MKRYIVLFIVAVFSSISVYGQTVLGYMGEVNLANTITLFPKKDGTYTISIPLSRGVFTDFGSEPKITFIRLVIDNNNLDEFVQALSMTKAKYEEWSSVAKKNNVQKMHKAIDVSFPTIKVSGVLSGNSFSVNSLLEPSFFVHNSSCSVSFVDITPSISKKDLYKIINFSFSSSKEIEDLIRSINPESIRSILRKEKRESDLFK